MSSPIPEAEPCEECGNACYDVGDLARDTCCNCADIDDKCPDCHFMAYADDD